MRPSILLTLAFLSACGSPEATRSYFAARQGDFERVVQMVDACRPTLHYVRADGFNVDGPSDTRCANGGRDIVALRRELAARGFDQIIYTAPSDDPMRPDPRSAISSVAISDGKLYCDVIFETAADPDGGRHIYSAFADEYERYPLTGPPHHWFCESIGF